MDYAQEIEQHMLEKTKPIIEAAAAGDSDIQTFYKGKTIFLTGGSGFIGKLVIEKLFRACAINKLYILIRSKKNLKPRERLDKILEDPVFNGLHKEQPKFADKIVTVQGDISEPNIGLNDDDWNTIADEVEVIFHVAANVKFDVGLKEAVLTNARGTRDMLRLGKACRRLKSMVYVSTAYSHATRNREGTDIYEQFYHSPAPPDAVIQMAESFDDAKLESLTECWKRDWPNTYTMSKALADEVIRTQAGNLPICIVKPTIVISTHCEPTPGWVDLSCAFGASGNMLGIGLGVMHTMLMDKDKVADIVPVDMVANAVIATAWETVRKGRSGEPKIYTVSSKRNPTKWSFHGDLYRNIGPEIVTPKMVWYPWALETSNKLLFLLMTWLFHYIPAYIIDTVCLIMGKQQRFVRLYTKIYKINHVFSYFLLGEWFFHDDNTLKLYMDMSETDRTIFNFNVETLNIKELIITWMIGLRKYIVKDNLEGTEYAKKKWYWFGILHYISLVLYAFVWWKFIEWSYLFISFTFSYFLTIAMNTSTENHIK